MSRYRAVLLSSAIALLLNAAPARAGALSAEDLMNMPLERLVNVQVLITGSSKYAEKINEAYQILSDPEEAHDATEPSAVLRHDDEESGEPTQPSATLAPNEAPGPQGAYDTHGWWAEQKEAAREEQARRQASGEKGDDSMAAAEEQGW